jgi:hypothetical protein
MLRLFLLLALVAFVVVKGAKDEEEEMEAR